MQLVFLFFWASVLNYGVDIQITLRGFGYKNPRFGMRKIFLSLLMGMNPSARSESIIYPGSPPPPGRCSPVSVVVLPHMYTRMYGFPPDLHWHVVEMN